MVSDFSCDGVPMGDNGERSGRLRIQAHLSSSGLGVTCRILNDFIPSLDSLGIDPDTTDTLKHSVLKTCRTLSCHRPDRVREVDYPRVPDRLASSESSETYRNG